MRNQNFIPDKVDPLDSDDSSIHGGYVNGVEVNEDLSDEDLNGEEEELSYDESNFSDLSDFKPDCDIDDDDSSDSDSMETGAQGESSHIQLRSQHRGDAMRQDSADEGHSGDESDDEEGSKVTMSEFFGNKPNIETERNHPPNFKTDSPVLDLCFHPESELLAVAGIDGDSVLYRYSLEKVEEVSRFSHHKKSCRQICFNADGKILYTVSKDKSLAVVDAESAAVKLHFKDAHESPIYSFCEVDENVCCTGDDDGIVKLWDVRKPEAVFSEKCGEQTISSLMSCRAKKFLSATVTDGSVTGFNLRKRRIEAQSEMFDSEFTCQSLVRSETRMVVGSGSGILYIFKWGDFGYNVDALSGHPDLIQCQAAISDKLIITGCEDGNIRVIQLYDHKFLGIIGQHHDFGVENIGVSCDGFLLASCSMDEEIQFWNIEYLYGRVSTNKKKTRSKSAVGFNLPSSKKRNAGDFFKDIPTKVEDEDEGGQCPAPAMTRTE